MRMKKGCDNGNAMASQAIMLTTTYRYVGCGNTNFDVGCANYG